MFAPIRPRSAALRTSSRERFQLCCSSSSRCGVTSLSTNCRVVSAIMRCSSVKSSGVKISSGVRSSIKNDPPLKIFFCSATADIWVSPLSFSQALKNPGGAHATANTHRHHSISSITSLKFAQDTCREFRARATERMTKRDRAAVYINPFRIETESFYYSERLRRKRLVQLDQIDVVEREPGEL